MGLLNVKDRNIVKEAMNGKNKTKNHQQNLQISCGKMLIIYFDKKNFSLY